MSRIADQVGRVLGGRYRLLAPIGTGASAHVYAADDTRLRRRVAVKVLHAALADDQAFLRRFRAEAEAVAALRHPNIMNVYDHGEDDGSPYLVLELLGGGSLRSMLQRGNLLSPSQALVVGLEAGRRLDAAGLIQGLDRAARSLPAPDPLRITRTGRDTSGGPDTSVLDLTVLPSSVGIDEDLTDLIPAGRPDGIGSDGGAEAVVRRRR